MSWRRGGAVRGAVIAAAGGACITIALSCASFTSDDVSPPLVAPGDAATEVSSSMPDGGAGNDALPAVEAGGRLCATKAGAAICDDFDDPLGAPFDPPWTVFTSDAGTVVRGSPATTPPNAVVFAAPATDSAGQARIEQTISGKLAQLTCTFDMRFDKLPAGGFEFAHLRVEGGGTSKLLILTDDAIKVSGGTSAPATPMGAGAWGHYELVVAYGSTATISKNGGPSSVVPISDFPVPETTLVSFGLEFKPSGDMQFRIDTLVCEGK